MSEFSILKVIQDAEEIVDETPKEDLDKLLHQDTIQFQYDRIKKWENLRTKAESGAHPKKIEFLAFLNLIQFTRISILDLSIVFDRIIKSESDIEKQFLYRICSVLVYEIIEDFPELLGKKIRSSIISLTDNNEAILQDLNDIAKGISALKKEYLIEIVKEIRNISIAHKDHDSRKLLDTIESIKENEIITLIAYIFAWNRTFEGFQEKLVKQFG